MLNYLRFFADNTKCALVVAMLEKIKYHSVWLQEVWNHANMFSQTLADGNSKNEIS